jgi:hypothetical protein
VDNSKSIDLGLWKTPLMYSTAKRIEIANREAHFGQYFLKMLHLQTRTTKKLENNLQKT